MDALRGLLCRTLGQHSCRALIVGRLFGGDCFLIRRDQFAFRAGARFGCRPRGRRGFDLLCRACSGLFLDSHPFKVRRRGALRRCDAALSQVQGLFGIAPAVRGKLPQALRRLARGLLDGQCLFGGQRGHALRFESLR